MSYSWRPSSLVLKSLADIETRSPTKALLFAEQFWPNELMTQPVVRLPVGGRSVYFVSEPNCARELLTLGDEKLPKAFIYEKVLGYSTGKQSVSASSGELSLRLRRRFTPVFARTLVNSMVPLFNHYMEKLTAEWQDGQRLDIAGVTQEITLRGICRILFGEADLSIPLPGVLEEVTPALQEALMLGELRRQTEIFDQIAQGMLRHSPSRSLLPDNPFLQPDDERNALSDVEKLHNFRVFVAAGSETTALTLTWCLWILGSCPEVQEALYSEIREKVGDAPITAEVLSELPLLAQVMHETMRLFPTAPLTAREARCDIEVGGHKFEAGSVIAVNFYGLHRSPAIWERPDDFFPERFADYDSNPEKFAAFMPFSYGPHACIGARLGRVETLTLLANFLRDYRYEAEDQELVPRMRITLRPQKPVWLRVYRR